MASWAALWVIMLQSWPLIWSRTSPIWGEQWREHHQPTHLEPGHLARRPVGDVDDGERLLHIDSSLEAQPPGSRSGASESDLGFENTNGKDLLMLAHLHPSGHGGADCKQGKQPQLRSRCWIQRTALSKLLSIEFSATLCVRGRQWSQTLKI